MGHPLGLALALLLAACGSSDISSPLPVDPGPSEYLTVGSVASTRQSSSVIEYTLRDGRAVTVDASTSRQVHDGAGDALLVIGRDRAGPWFAVVGTQSGMPATCHVLNDHGTDWGRYIEIAGVAWVKDPFFRSEVGNVGPGTRYPESTRFCLNDKARVSVARP